MTLPIFGFKFGGGGYQENKFFDDEVGETESGQDFALALHTVSRILIAGMTVQFPQAGALKEEDLDAFFALVRGRQLPWLVKARKPHNRDFTDSFVSGAAQADFLLTWGFIDAATVVVKVNTVTQTEGVDYTLDGNTLVASPRPSPFIHFLGGKEPALDDDVDVTGEAYLIVKFAIPELPAPVIVPGATRAQPGTVRVGPIALNEYRPGGRFAA